MTKPSKLERAVAIVVGPIGVPIAVFYLSIQIQRYAPRPWADDAVLICFLGTVFGFLGSVAGIALAENHYRAMEAEDAYRREDEPRPKPMPYLLAVLLCWGMLSFAAIIIFLAFALFC